MLPWDPSEYHPDWKQISERIRFERAKGFCEWCNAEHGKPHPDTGSKVVLTVAHLNHNKRDNRGRNLAALCQRCHLNHDRHIHIRKAAETRRRKKLEREPELPLGDES